MDHQPSDAVFADDRQWLQTQPGMNPWPQACRRLAECLDRWLGEYSAVLCAAPVRPDGAGYRRFVCRLWRCWGHHWRQAAAAPPEGRADGAEVASQIRAGRGYRRGGKLGGDPLRDVVLAVAVQLKDNRATGHFQADYYDFSRGIAGGVHHRFARDPDEWWNDFMDHLAGYTRPPGKLERFFGRCALRNWLPTVLWRFLRRRRLPEGDGDLPAGHAAPPAAEADLDGNVQLFSEVVLAAITQLDGPDKLLLRSLFVDQSELKNVALELRVHPGTAGRRRDRAIEHLCELIEQRVAERGQQQVWQECLEHLGTNPRDFAAALCAILKAAGHKEDER